MINREEFIDFLEGLSYQYDIQVFPEYHGRYWFKGIGVVYNDPSDWQKVIWEIATDGRFDDLKNASIHTDSMGLGAISAWSNSNFTEMENVS